ncbi:MAG: hypothetical protein KDB90_00655 [Planctomycetes bacterium]|nr:hypothetical protein [Planctomycetota bacterium]
MKDVFPMVAVGMIALLLGAVATWFAVGTKDTPTPASNYTAVASNGNQSLCGGEPLTANEAGSADGTASLDGDLQALLATSKNRVAELETENRDLRQSKAELEAEKAKLEGKIDELNTALEAAAQPEGKTGELPVSFGKWGEVEGLRNANWKEIGDVYTKLDAILKERVTALREGRQPDPEGPKQIAALNVKLQNHLVSFFNKLPSNSGPNGQFTHPANTVNTLAGQLAAAGVPLSDDQIEQLKKLGEEYDERWDALQKGYTDATWDLEKVVDECELKEWFHDEMFKVCTSQQKAVAIAPEIEGIAGIDFYSTGIVLQMGYIHPVTVNELAQVKPQLREWIAGQTALAAETLDAADYLFDDWVNALSAQLAPKAEIDASLVPTWDILHAGRAQLNFMKALRDSYAATPEAKKKIAAIRQIALPQVVKGE